MSYEPTSEEVERAKLAAFPGLPQSFNEDEDERRIKAAIRAFVPEGTVPVFLTRENLDLAHKLAQERAGGLAQPGSLLAALDAALNREQA